MPSPVNILYGNFNFSGIGLAVPYLSQSQEVNHYANKHGQVTSLTLNGKIYGSYGDITGDRYKITSGFSSDFRTLVVTESGGPGASEKNKTILTHSGCIVDDIRFEPVNDGICNYDISMTCYESGLFTNSFGVLNPQNEYTFSQDTDTAVSISHTVSAQGVQTEWSAGAGGVIPYTHKPALSNAINFVNTLTGYVPSDMVPTGFSGFDASNLVLVSLNKDIDRSSATYSISELWKMQNDHLYISGNTKAPVVSGYLSDIITDISSGTNEDFLEVKVSYGLLGGRTKSLAETRTALTTYVGTGTLHSIATGASTNTGLFYLPESLSIDEASGSNKISLTATFIDEDLYVAVGSKKLMSEQGSTHTVDTNVLGAVVKNSGWAYFDYDVSLDTDELTSITSISIDGRIKSRGITDNKYANASGYFDMVTKNANDGWTGFLYGLVRPVYTGIKGSTSWQVNPYPLNISVNENKFLGEISVSATFDNKDFITGFLETSYSISNKPAMKKYVSKASCNENGVYGVYDMNMKTREAITIAGNLKATQENTDWKNQVHDLIDDLQAKYSVGDKARGGSLEHTDPLLSSEDITVEGSPGNSANFNYGFSTQANSPFHS